MAREDIIQWVREKTRGMVNISKFVGGSWVGWSLMLTLCTAMVHMLKDALGRPSGEAYLELNSEEECK